MANNNYPNIFVHGFFGWGEGDLLNKILPYFGGFGAIGNRGIDKYLSNLGYETYCPFVGPWTSAWDRACELWAIINGGTVDYGKVHSEKYGHARFGRTYPGLIPDWGTGKGHEKINIIGHSFGGPTVIAFTSLMEQGSEEERNGTPADELSPFFKGGHGHMVHTATTLSGTNNGTTLASAAKALHVDKFVNWLFYGATTMIGESKVQKVWDMYMDQWGLSKDSRELGNTKLLSPFAKKDIVNHINHIGADNIMDEMTVEHWAECNKTYVTSPSMYYFARRACRSHEVFGTKFQLMDLKSFPIAHIGALLTGVYNSPTLKRKYGVDSSWYANDGAVNVPAQDAPIGKPADTWAPGKKIEPGVWYNMPVEYKDHFSWMGMLESTPVYKLYYLDMVKSFGELPDVK